jgi:hypothetical protein
MMQIEITTSSELHPPVSMRRRLTMIGIAFIVGSVLALSFLPPLYPPYAEGNDYLSVAKLDYANVHSYYGGRVLHPFTVRIVAAAANAPIDARVFRWVSIASLIAFFLVLAVYFPVGVTGDPVLLLLVATPLLIDLYRNYYWQDLFYTALSALFFLASRWNKWASLPILFLLYLTRESTIVLAFVVVIIAFFYRQKIFAVAALIVGAAGLKATSVLVSHSLPSKHGVSAVVLDGLKIPYNVMLNFFGLQFWTNTNADTITLPRKWVVTLPGWVHLGSIHEVGYCGFFWTKPVFLALILTSAFGVLPIVLLRRTRLKRLLRERYDISLVFLYGTLMFVLAPMVATGERYFMYAWPLFWIVSLSAIDKLTKKERVTVILLSIAAAWTPALLHLIEQNENHGSFYDLSKAALIISAIALGFINVAAWAILRRTDTPTAAHILEV